MTGQPFNCCLERGREGMTLRQSAAEPPMVFDFQLHCWEFSSFSGIKNPLTTGTWQPHNKPFTRSRPVFISSTSRRSSPKSSARARNPTDPFLQLLTTSIPTVLSFLYTLSLLLRVPFLCYTETWLGCASTVYSFLRYVQRKLYAHLLILLYTVSH